MKSTIQPESFLNKMRPEDRKPLGKAGRTNAEIEAEMIAKGEGDLQKQIANLLNLRSIVFLQSRFGKKTRIKIGWTDFTFALFGKACAVEVKFGNAKPTEEQSKLHEKLRGNGWAVEVVYSIDQFRKFLDTQSLLQSIT